MGSEMCIRDSSIVGEEIVAWREGIEMVRKSARYVGMGPTSLSVAWREGIEMARKSARYVGMGPTSLSVAWREGIEMVRKSARYVSMGPTSLSGNIDLEEDSTYADQLWFFEPLKHVDSALDEEMVSEDGIAMNQNSNNVGASSSSAGMNRDDSEDSNESICSNRISNPKIIWCHQNKCHQNKVYLYNEDHGQLSSPQNFVRRHSLVHTGNIESTR